ncbi:delta-8 sphingolipid desaturase [Scheffersomyces coipomensis]|uniref:delta-8 sphingolipid desaturase n=1 Tax=Scheffersomyces coipomensis TaxID=1788519 RepID=UPI00315D199C
MSKRSSKILSRSDIIDLIADGKVIVIYENNVLNLTHWIKNHPGGDKAIYHLVGRDATDEMNAYHSYESIATFTKWKIGEIDQYWKNLLPPLQGGIYKRGKYDEQDITTADDFEMLPSRSKSLDDKLDNLSSSTSSSDDETASPVSSTAPSDDIFPKNYSAGYPHVNTVKPVVPQNTLITGKNIDQLFPLGNSEQNDSSKKPIVVDPKVLMTNYDNELTRKDILQLPALDYKTQQNLRDKYNELHDIIIRNGFYDCDLWNYGRELIKIGSLFLYAFSFLKLNYLTLSAVCIGMAWHQMTFIAHDSGHVSLTHNYQLDNLFGMIIADWFGGLSLGWWKRNHNVHHLVTNDPVHDPDIQHLPFFAVSVRLFNNVYSTYYDNYLWFDKAAEYLIPIQKYMYYPILSLGRFNLYFLSWSHLIRGLGPRSGKAAWFRYFELAGLSFFFYWFFYLVVFKSIDGWGNRLLYVLVSHVSTMLVHVQITLSHFAMSTSDLGVSESFPSRQLRTTMDVDCPEWLDFFHGGLQFQVIHHLFPRLPRHNFRRVQPFVIKFCEEVGLTYSIYGFGEGNEIVISKLGEIGKQCSIMLDATRKYDGDLY